MAVSEPPLDLAIRAAKEIASGSSLRTDAPVRKAFVRAPSDAPDAHVAPLLRLYRGASGKPGGRGGRLAVLLYVSLLWKSSSSPWDSDAPYTAWAQLLALPDFTGDGARRIAAAMDRLKSECLIEIAPIPGHASVITLRHDAGLLEGPDGGPVAYSRPTGGDSGSNPDEPATFRELYFKVNQEMWTTGVIQTLSGPGLVMLLILLAEQADSKAIWFATDTFRQRYGISHTTRASGTKELESLGLLNCHRERVSVKAPNVVFAEKKYRTIYSLRATATPYVPPVTPSSGAHKRGGSAANSGVDSIKPASRRRRVVERPEGA